MFNLILINQLRLLWLRSLAWID